MKWVVNEDKSCVGQKRAQQLCLCFNRINLGKEGWKFLENKRHV